MSNALRQQLHLRIKVSCVCNILLTVVLCVTLKPNDKSCMGLRFKLIEGILRLECIRVYWTRILFSVRCLAIYIHFVLNFAQSSGIKNYWKCDSEELFERNLVVNFVLHYSRKRLFRKGFNPELRWEIYLHDSHNCSLFAHTQLK